MEKEMSSTMSALFKTDKCSPLIVYIVLVVVTGVTLFNTNGLMKRLQNHKIDNIFTMHAWYEISMLLVLGVILFGLCQYNQQTLAWIVLFFPIFWYLVKTLLVFNTVSSILRHVPPDSPVPTPLPRPDPTKGPGPPRDSGHLAPDSPTVQQTEGVRRALSERRDNIAGNQLPSNFQAPLGSPF